MAFLFIVLILVIAFVIAAPGELTRTLLAMSWVVLGLVAVGSTAAALVR